MSEKIKTALCVIGILAMLALAQTMDYHDQQQLEVAAPSSHYIAWHKEMMASTGDNWTREERDAYIARWKEENPDLAPIINTRWREPQSQKVARQ